VRSEERPDPVIMDPTDATVRAVATCVYGSDLLAQLAADRTRLATVSPALGEDARSR
jgi:threonine dehydrogenase-like Zn-dependent dehydrogenase